MGDALGKASRGRRKMRKRKRRKRTKEKGRSEERVIIMIAGAKWHFRKM